MLYRIMVFSLMTLTCSSASYAGDFISWACTIRNESTSSDPFTLRCIENGDGCNSDELSIAAGTNSFKVEATQLSISFSEIASGEKGALMILDFASQGSRVSAAFPEKEFALMSKNYQMVCKETFNAARNR